MKDDEIGDAADNYKLKNPKETQKTFFWAGALWAKEKLGDLSYTHSELSDISILNICSSEELMSLRKAANSDELLILFARTIIAASK